MIRCKMSCTEPCETCYKRRKFTIDYKLYDFHSQVAPAGLALFMLPIKEKKTPEQRITLMDWPFVAITAWIDMVVALNNIAMGRRRARA